MISTHKFYFIMGAYYLSIFFSFSSPPRRQNPAAHRRDTEAAGRTFLFLFCCRGAISPLPGLRESRLNAAGYPLGWE